MLVVLLVVSLLLAAFAAAAETSLTSVSRLRIRSLAEEGNERAVQVEKLHKDPNGYLSTILTVNTVAVIMASTSAALIAVQNFVSIPEFVVTIVLAIFVLVFCEIAPKALALRFNERLALWFARPVSVVTQALRPLVNALTWVSTVLVRATTRGRVHGPFVTEEELKMLVLMGEQEGVVEEEEREMIHGILEMTDKPAREVMVPRVDVVGMQATSTVDDAIKLIIDNGHSRIPVYEETIDNVVGILYAKDVLLHRGEQSSGTAVRAFARPPFFTPEAKKLGELLHEMQERGTHMGIVVDEYGGTAGIVTIEDLIEEIVGPIRDEYDAVEPEEVQFISDHEVLLNARVSIEDVKEMLHLDIADTDADSIGGLVYERLGEIPKPGDRINLDDALLIVETVRRQSIRTVRITRSTPFASDSMNHVRDVG